MNQFTHEVAARGEIKHFTAFAHRHRPSLHSTGREKATEVATRFKQKLTKPQQVEHALSRLTFGRRPGDAEAVSKLGLNKWIERQLNPSSIAENPELESKLAFMPTLTLSTEQLALQYPTPQILAAIANGRMKMPEDPALKDVYQRLSQRYKSLIEAETGKGDNPRRRVGAMSTKQRSEALKRIAPQ